MSPAYLSSQILIVLTSSSEISSEIIVFVLKFFCFQSVFLTLAVTALLRDFDFVFSSFSSDSWITQSLIMSLTDYYYYYYYSSIEVYAV